MSDFDVNSWLNSSWSLLNGSDWLEGENSTAQPPVSPSPDLIFKILEGILEYRIAKHLTTYGYIVIIIMGTIGNGLSFFVMTQKSMIHLSTCFYMAVLAIADTFILYFSCLRRVITNFTRYEISNVSPAGCRILTFLNYWCFQYSVWILVLMTVDRFIIIHFPLKAVSFRILRYPKLLVGLTTVVTSLFDIQYFFIVDINDEGNCQPLTEHYPFHEKVWPWLDATLYSFLPFLLLILFNTIIICDSHKAEKRQQSLQADYVYTSTAIQVRQDVNNKITVMLLIVSFAFLVMSSPRVILHIIRNNVYQFYSETGQVHWQELANYTLVSAIVSLLLYLNHSINFFLYCLSGQKFRTELKRIFRRKNFIPKRQQSIVLSACTSMSEFTSSERRCSTSITSDGSQTLDVCDRPEPSNMSICLN